jgi:type III pantothenate kinase
VAAHAKWGGPVVVVDFGTSTNFDVVSADGEYIGGVLATGLKVSADALFSATARLPRIELTTPRSVIARNTVESLQAGLVYGTAAMVDGIVGRIQDEVGPATVVATGGLADVVVAECRSVQHVEPWLTLEGLRIVYDLNAGRHD